MLGSFLFESKYNCVFSLAGAAAADSAARDFRNSESFDAEQAGRIALKLAAR